MNAAADALRPGAPAGTPVLMAKLAVLGMIAGAISWGLVNFADQLNMKFEYEGYGLELLPIGVYPGLAFGFLFGGFLRLGAGISWPRATGYVAAAGLAYLAAFHVAFYLIATIDQQGPLTVTLSGVPAGLAGSLVLGLLAKFLLRVPVRLVLRLPVVVGTLTGALLGLGTIDDHNGWGFLAFFVLWQGAYGASLAPMVQAGVRPSV